jgi:hypothetical protein
MAGVSTLRPTPSEVIRRSSCAWAQLSGEADPAALPSVNPIDAVAGSLPNGEAGRSGSSQACSGTSPTPDEKLITAWSSDAAPRESPAARSDLARSPDRFGHRCPVPVPVGAHGAPTVVHEVWLGWKQSPYPSALPGAAEVPYR